MELKYKNWNDITIGKFSEIEQALQEDMYVEDQEIFFMSLLCDCSEDDILDLPLTEFQRLKRECAFLNQKPKITNKCPDKIIINGKTCDVIKDIKKLTAAQYIDFQQMAVNPDLFLPNLIACFVVPEGKKYGKDYDVGDFANEIEQSLSIITALDMFHFFQNAFLNSIKGIRLYLDLKIKKMSRKAKTKEQKESLKKARIMVNQLLSEKNGDGLVALIQSLKP